MSPKLHHFSAGVLASSILGYLSCHTLATAAPNIIIFLADDLGYADIGANGCKDIPTPNIDSLAKNDVRFTEGYATHSVCSPSRALVMVIRLRLANLGALRRRLRIPVLRNRARQHRTCRG